MHKKSRDTMPVEDRDDIDAVVQRVAVHVGRLPSKPRIRINEYDVLPIAAQVVGSARVRVTLRVPVEALDAARHAAANNELVLEILNLVPSAARHIVRAVPIRKEPPRQ